MATLSQFSLNVTNTGVTVTIPDDDVARLMYYLNCVTVGVGLDILHDDLVDYQNYGRLTLARTNLVFKSAIEFSPDEFIDKVIFLDNEGEVVTGTSTNKFCKIEAACDIVSLQRDIIIAGKVQNAANVMFFKSAWLDRYYYQPLARNKMRIARAIGSRHCIHCEGSEGMCACSECPRISDSQCVSMGDLLEVLTGISSTTSRAPSPKPTRPKHNSTCDGCRWEYIEGTRYKCKVCYDFDLCESCYKGNVHDLSHPFLQIDRPGADAVNLAPRAPPRPPPSPRPPPVRREAPAPAPRAMPTSHPSPSLHAPPATHTTVPDHPPPYTSEPAINNDPVFFYNDMSVSELRSYLKDRGVLSGDILDKETLRRRVWETHCDCMSMGELNLFLSENNISTADCRDIASRRQKAKDAFQVLRPAAPTHVARFAEGDQVVLSGLSRAEMNGKTATVIQADAGGGRAEVHIGELGRAFKVKFENLTITSTLADNDDDFLN